jgi:hypothetical protein
MNRPASSADIPPAIRDPFVDPRVCMDGRKKSLEEILRGIKGFRLADSDESFRESNPDRNSPDIQIQLTTKKVPTASASEETDEKGIAAKERNAVPSAAENRPLSGLTRSSIIPSEIFHGVTMSSQHASQHASPHVLSAMKMATPGVRIPTARVSKSYEVPGLLHFPNENELTSVDIREFCSAEPLGNRSLEPIPGAYEHDPDYFEYHATQERFIQLESLHQELNRIGSTADESELLIHGSETPENAQVSTETEEGLASVSRHCEPPLDPVSDEQTEIIYAKDQQVIYVDGRDGFQYIDLSCFDLSQASFEANRIRICTSQQAFEIDYRNVTHVVFAQCQEIELAAFEGQRVPSQTTTR